MADATIRPSPGLLGRPHVLIATAGGIGLLRPAPGTWASAATAAAVLPCLPWLPPGALALLALAVGLVGVWSSGAEARRSGIDDPGWVVVDEVAGMLVGLALIPPGVAGPSPLASVLLVFLLFRVYDIAKPWPLARLEHLPGGWGIMADDLAAGALSGILATAVMR